MVEGRLRLIVLLSFPSDIRVSLGMKPANSLPGSEGEIAAVTEA